MPTLSAAKNDLFFMFMVAVQMVWPQLLGLLLALTLLGSLEALALPLARLWPDQGPLAVQVGLMLLVAELLRYPLHVAAQHSLSSGPGFGFSPRGPRAAVGSHSPGFVRPCPPRRVSRSWGISPASCGARWSPSWTSRPAPRRSTRTSSSSWSETTGTQTDRAFARSSSSSDADQAVYRLVVEPAAPTESWRGRLRGVVDNKLAAANLEYAAKRASGRLRPLDLLTVRPGTGDAYKRHCLERGQREGQFKLIALQYQSECAFPFIDFGSDGPGDAA